MATDCAIWMFLIPYYTIYCAKSKELLKNFQAMIMKKIFHDLAKMNRGKLALRNAIKEVHTRLLALVQQNQIVSGTILYGDGVFYKIASLQAQKRIGSMLLVSLFDNLKLIEILTLFHNMSFLGLWPCLHYTR